MSKVNLAAVLSAELLCRPIPCCCFVGQLNDFPIQFSHCATKDKRVTIFSDFPCLLIWEGRHNSRSLAGIHGDRAKGAQWDLFSTPHSQSDCHAQVCMPGITAHKGIQALSNSPSDMPNTVLGPSYRWIHLIITKTYEVLASFSRQENWDPEKASHLPKVTCTVRGIAGPYQAVWLQNLCSWPLTIHLHVGDASSWMKVLASNSFLNLCFHCPTPKKPQVLKFRYVGVYVIYSLRGENKVFSLWIVASLQNEASG